MELKNIKIYDHLYLTIFKKIRINLLIIPLFFSAFIFNFAELLFISYLTALIHECFHIAAMKFLGIPLKKIDIQPFGICAYINNVSVFSSYKEVLIAAAGPLFNFSLALVLICIKHFTYFEYLDYAININILMGAFNLIPALPLDGGRILRAILSIKFGIIRAYNFMLSLSRKIIICILAAGIFIVIFVPFNFSLLLICAFLFSNIASEEKCLNRIILKDILLAKEGKSSNKPLDTKVVTVSEDSPARSILKLLSFDYCIEVLILGRQGNIRYCASESEVVKLLIERGIRSKFMDLY